MSTENFVQGPKVFQRGAARFLAFYAAPVWDMDEFDRLYPPPVNNHVYYARDETGKGSQTTDWEHPEYLAAEDRRGKARWGYVILKSLQPSVVAYWADIEVEEEVLDDDGNVVIDKETEEPVTHKVPKRVAKTEPLTIPGCSLADPTTWHKAEALLEEFLPHYEFNQIYTFVHEANSISQAKLEDNLQSFFQIMAQHTTDTSPNSGLSNIPDSEHANDSE